MNTAIYLHVFDRELRTFTGAKLTDNYVYEVVLTSTLLSDVIYMANSNLLESSADFPNSVGLVYELERAFHAQIITTTDNPAEFIEKRQKLYNAVKDRYPMYFEAETIKFPSLPYVVCDSTTEFLRNRMLNETNDAIPKVIQHKYDAFRNVLIAKDENAITIGVLNQRLDLIPPEQRYAANLISESYTVRYLNVMGGQLIKHLAGLKHFDYLSGGNLYYDFYYPILLYSILRFLKDEDGGYDSYKVASRMTALKLDRYFQVFLELLKQSITALHVFFTEREKNSNKTQFVLLQLRQVVIKYFVESFAQMRELNTKLMLDIMIRVKDDIKRDFNIDVDMGNTKENRMKVVLYVVATPTELKRVTDFYKEKGVTLTPHTHDANTYWDLGIIRNNHVFLVKCEMGAKKANASILTIDHAISYLNPDYVIMVGIGFALREDKLKKEDIMVASEIWDCGSYKIEDGTIIERGNRIQADKTLLDRFTNAIVNWDGVDVRFGLVITNDVLVDDEKYVGALKARFPDAIGGEMEGCGLLANYQTPWILVKAVCDYGYHKDDENQKGAATNAIKYVDYVLREFDL